MAQSGLHNNIAEERAAAGLSQAELARRVGVSRQGLSAIEGGRQVPSTPLALRLAGALGTTVERLFRVPPGRGLEVRVSSHVVDAKDGTRLVVGRVGGIWVGHPLADGSPAAANAVVAGHAGETAARAGAPAWVLPDGAQRVTTEPLADLSHLEGNVLVAGCAPLLGLLAGRLHQKSRDASATWLLANSARALDALAAGDVHVAGLHLGEGGDPRGHVDLLRRRFPARRMLLVNLTLWRQGLAVAKGNPLGIRTADDVRRPDVRFARREEGAGASRLISRLLGGEGRDARPRTTGPLATGHAEVARMVEAGVADTGVTIEASALAAGLDFVPLAEERFDLVLLEERTAEAPVARFLDALGHRSFRLEAGRLPGYDLSATGHVVTVSAA